MSGEGGRSASRWATARPDRCVGGCDPGPGAKRSAEVDALRRAQRLDRHHLLGPIDRLSQVERRRGAHAHVVLLVGAGRDAVDRCRMGQRLQLVHQGRRRVVGDHQPALDARPLGEEGRQAGREMRIHEACGPPLGDRRQLRDGHRGVVERQCQRLAVEVAAADHLSRREDEWVVGRRVDLDAEDALELGQRVASGAVDLRHAAEAVGVLHPVLGIGAMGRPDLAVRQQRAQVPGRCDLPRVRARGDQLLREGGAGAEHRLEAHRADDVGGQRQPHGVVMSERADPGHQLGPVEQRQAFLCLAARSARARRAPAPRLRRPGRHRRRSPRPPR